MQTILSASGDLETSCGPLRTTTFGVGPRVNRIPSLPVRRPLIKLVNRMLIVHIVLKGFVCFQVTGYMAASSCSGDTLLYNLA